MECAKALCRLLLIAGAFAILGCGGGGGGSGGGGTTATSMKDITPPANAGVVGGFVYASQQNVAVDIVVPADKQVVTIYDKRPSNNSYNASGIWQATPTITMPVELAKGMSSLDTTDNKFHYKTFITVPTAATSVYVQSYTSAVVAITAGKVSATFDAGGIL